MQMQLQFRENKKNEKALPLPPVLLERCAMALPLRVAFAKPDRGGLQVSPLGRWAAWWARDAHGVLQLWVPPRRGV